MAIPQPVGHQLGPGYQLKADIRPQDVLAQWTRQLKSGDNDSFLSTVETYLPGNCFQQGNQLVLEARNTGGGHIAGGTYTSGCVTSFNCFSWLYGYYEVVAQMPSGAGMWPAIWMLYTTVAQIYEIDLCELVIDPTSQNCGVHFPTSPTHHGGAFPVPNMSADFHAYAVDWTPNYVRLYFDGKLQFQTTTPAEIPSQFMYGLINIQVGGNFGNGLPGPPPFVGQTFPQQLRVQSIRLWQPDQSPYALATTITPNYATYRAAVLADTPFALYPLSDAFGATTVADISGNNHPGTVTGGVTLGSAASCLAGDTAKAASFDGSTGYITLPSAVTSDGASAYSIEILFRPTQAFTGNPRLLNNGHTDITHVGMELALNNNMNGGFGSVAANSTNNLFYGTPFSIGTNYHLALTYDGAKSRMYVNGTQVGSGTTSGAIAASGLPFVIGRAAYSASDPYNGVAAWAATYTQALTAQQVLAHANAAFSAPPHASVATGSDLALAAVTATDTASF